LRQRSSTLVNKDSRDDDDSTFKDDTTDYDDSTFKDNTLDDERNYKATQFEKIPLPIDNYVEYNSNNDIYLLKPADKTKASGYGNCK
jgi:hypothetical protein